MLLLPLCANENEVVPLDWEGQRGDSGWRRCLILGAVLVWTLVLLLKLVLLVLFGECGD
jgi:hypothetical protein